MYTWMYLSRMQRIREGIHIRTMKAKRKVEEVSKEDVQAFLKKNAFVLFTVGAVILGVYASRNYIKMNPSRLLSVRVNAVEKHFFLLCRYYPWICTASI